MHTFEFGKFKPGNKIFIKTFNQITNNSFLNKTEQVLEEKKDIKKKELKKEIKIFSSNHEGHYILSYELFKKDPVWGIGPKGFWSMMFFLGVLTIGFIYEWKKGALEWE